MVLFVWSVLRNLHGESRAVALLARELCSSCCNAFPSSFCCAMSYISQLIHLTEWRLMQKMPQVLWHHLLEIFPLIELWVNVLLLQLCLHCRHSEGIFSFYLQCCLLVVSFLKSWPFLFCQLCCLMKWPPVMWFALVQNTLNFKIFRSLYLAEMICQWASDFSSSGFQKSCGFIRSSFY